MKRCAHCEGQMSGPGQKRYCSPKCRDAAKRRRQGIEPRPQVAEHECQQCGERFKPKRSDRTTFCSRQCSFKHRAAPPPFTSVRAFWCAGCGKAVCTSGPRYRTCSVECSKESARRAERHKAEREKASKIYVCRGCGDEFKSPYGEKRRSFCGDECRYRIQRIEQCRHHRQRARKHGVPYEPVNALRVFARDGWRCQICGRATPEMARGTRKSNAPELDHRIPLSKGGGHLYGNVQCACRACNISKGNASSVGQLPLLAA